MSLNKPIVGMAADLATGGYWLVASDGGIFAYKAPFFGSTGNIVLARPIVGMEANVAGSGYRLDASDGGVFAYGSSDFYGSAQLSPADYKCSVVLSSTSPPQNSNETVTIQSNVGNATVTLSLFYGGTPSFVYGTTDSNGNATITFNISGATVGYLVSVTATVGSAFCWGELHAHMRPHGSRLVASLVLPLMARVAPAACGGTSDTAPAAGKVTRPCTFANG